MSKDKPLQDGRARSLDQANTREVQKDEVNTVRQQYEKEGKLTNRIEYGIFLFGIVFMIFVIFCMISSCFERP